VVALPSKRVVGVGVAVLLTAVSAWYISGIVVAQEAPVTVIGTIALAGPGAAPASRADVVVWLKPIGETAHAPASPPAPPRFRIVQENKRFSPRILIVPTGSSVDFPNLDPFFHNVFSLFDGKRFDLGLYEAGTSRSVAFPRPGVCYIFCNIHPDMSAVVVIVDSVYYAASGRGGDFTIPNVPPGRYTLNVWHERFAPERPAEYPRAVVISSSTPALGSIRLVETGRSLPPHKNKFGSDYTPPGPSLVYP
jgi:plastocyanin